MKHVSIVQMIMTQHIISLLPDGYSMQHVDRDSGKRGGELAQVYKQSISVKCKKVKKYDQFQDVICTLSLKHKNSPNFITMCYYHK